MSSKINQDLITVGISQISPVWLNREQTLHKILQYVSQAADENCDVIVFGEAKPLIDRVYPFEQIPEAFHYVHKGMKTGNVVISVQEEENME